ncbi:MAG: CotH kinase family protein [Bacteroidia bacterium]|nr:CotH kinase family protein [Bacteroidia bacterium]
MFLCRLNKPLLPRIFILALLLLSGSAFSQPILPPNGPLFLQNEVASVYLEIDPDSLTFMLDNLQYAKDHDFPARFIYQSSVLTDTLDLVGLRLRGNTSLGAQKKSFKISFNAFQPGFEFHGIDKMNLNGEHNDPSLMRARLSWESLRKMGLPGSRTSFVRFYINGAYHGVYLNAEHIDREFAASRFNDDGQGNLFKCLYPADLAYLGENPELYKLQVNGRPVYDLLTNEAVADYSDLSAFISLLNNTPIPQLKCALDPVFNADEYLKVAAFDVLTGNWDGYIYNQNNYYLYHNQRSGRFEYIPYDLDNTLGVDWIGKDWTARDPYSWQTGNRPLYFRLLQVPEYRAEFTHYLNLYAQTVLHPDTIRARALEFQALIGPSVEIDPYYPLDYGFDSADFYASLDTAWGGQVAWGIAEYLDLRVSSLQGQLDPLNPDLLVLNHAQFSRTAEKELTFHARVEGNPAQVNLLLSQNDGPLLPQPMFDDGLHGDQLPGDGVYGVEFSFASWIDSFAFQYQAFNGGDTVVEPCEPLMMDLRYSEIKLKINELMASNSSGISDEFGQREDWIEIYNAGTQAVGLGQIYLSDDFTQPGKWHFPLLQLPPGGFTLVWADAQPEQGALHTHFKLSKDGEELALFQKSGDQFLLIDHVVFGPQQSNVSWGRQQDGQEPWVAFTQPTPNSSNQKPPTSQPDLIAWPNPNPGDILYLSQPTNLEIFNPLGQKIASHLQITQLDLHTYRPGIYLLRHPKGVLKLVIP